MACAVSESDEAFIHHCVPGRVLLRAGSARLVGGGPVSPVGSADSARGGLAEKKHTGNDAASSSLV